MLGGDGGAPGRSLKPESDVFLLLCLLCLCLEKGLKGV